MAQPEEAEQDNRQKAMQQRLRAMQLDQEKRNLVKRYMSVEAYERLMNVRVSNHELYSQIIDLIIAMAQSNRLTTQITEDHLKQILAKMTYKKEPTIEFKHK